MSAFTPRLDRAFAHAVHVAALSREDPLLTPGYARADTALRRATGGRAPRGLPPLPAIEALLVTPPGALLDDDWFARRWSGGEREACERHAAAAAERAQAFPAPRLLAHLAVREVIAATPLRGATAALVPGGVRVACGPGASGAAVVLNAIAARLAPALPLADLTPDDARFVRRHCAGSALLACGDATPVLDALLATAARDLPATHHGDSLEDRVVRLAPWLDQPPGELERLGRGLSRRYPDRLHRAWLRGVFVPRGFDLDGWLAVNLAPTPS